MKEKPILCKPVPGGLTEQEKAEAGLLYNPNCTTEMADYRFKIQDAIHEYNQFRPSQVQERRDFLANIFGKIKTVLLDVSLPVLIVAESLARELDFLSNVSTYFPDLQLIDDVYTVINWAGLVLFALAVIMTVVSGIVYIVQNKKVFEEK